MPSGLECAPHLRQISPGIAVLGLPIAGYNGSPLHQEPLRIERGLPAYLHLTKEALMYPAAVDLGLFI